MKFDRIAVIGISGSGKSTFAKKLAERTGLPLLHGDRLDWTENWGVRAKEELDAQHKDWIARPQWIIEGWIDPQRVERLNAADLVVDLALPGWLCATRVLARMLRGVRRIEMPEGCVDKFQPHVLDWVFFKRERPFIDDALRAANVRTYVQLKSRREAADWLDQI